MPDGNFIPEAVAGFKVYLGEESKDLIGIADVTLPDIETKKVKMEGSGVLGEFEVPLMGAVGTLKMVLKFRSVTGDLKEFLKPTAQKLSIRGGIQVTNSGNGIRSIQDWRIDAVGSALKTALGKFQVGEGTDSSVELDLTRIKILVDSLDYLLIDKLNNQYDVGGVSQIDALNKAMGI